MKSEWFDIKAKLNEEVQYNHGDICGDTRGRLYVKRTVLGFKWFCHNCSAKGKRPYMIDEMKQLNLFTGKEEETVDPIKYTDLPEKWDPLPYAATQWLKKYGLTTAEVDNNMIYFSDDINRLVLPIWDIDDKIRGWQGRNLDDITKLSPKYITKYLDSSKKTKSWHICNIDDQTLILVEDIISAIKVSRHETTCALLGSPKDLPDDFIQLVKHYGYKFVYIWLDPDKFTTALNYAKQFKALTNLDCRVILSSKDPKEHTDYEIMEKLGRADDSLEVVG